ncbi:MAG: MaoC/PaaZ C-terminal domain-containing protein [Ilumatobacteraceae bacterium]
MDPNDVVAWTVIAANLPGHARNPIHTDAGAQAAGFPRALVAGVTTYAYLTHPVVAAWGEEWLQSGGGEVRLRQPVFDKDTVSCEPTVDGDDVVIAAQTAESTAPRATFAAVQRSAQIDLLRAGEQLRSRRIELVGELGTDYGWGAGDDLALYRERGLVHPAVWPAIANQVVHVDVARGSWIHTRSIIRHHGLASAGATADVHATVVHRFTKPTGERAILDVLIEIDGRVVATLEHEAIVALPGF